MRLLLSVASFALLLSAAGPLFAGEVDPWRVSDLANLRGSAPHAAQLLEEGDGFMARGAYDDAHAQFQQAQTEAPGNALPWRDDCDLLVLAGRRAEAIKACELAFERTRSNENRLALERAHVLGPEAPSHKDVAAALWLTSFARRTAPPGWAARMACDIATRIGDGRMLQKCTEELLREAPNAEDTRRALAALQARCPAPRFWAGWAAILVALLVTAGHALLRRSRRRLLGPAAAAAAMVVASIVAPSSAAAADGSQIHWLGKWSVDLEHPEQSIPPEKERNADPLQFGYWLQDLDQLAERASKKGDHGAALRYFKAMALAVPDRAISYIKICEEQQALGDLRSAIEACGQALLRDGVSEPNFVKFVRLVLSQPGLLAAKDAAALEAVIAHMRSGSVASPVVDTLECEVGVRIEKQAMLAECTPGLVARAPTDPDTIWFQWNLAMMQHKYGSARGLVDDAWKAGMTGDRVAEMKAATGTAEGRYWARMALMVTSLGLFAAGVVVVAKNIRRWRAPPEGAAAPAPVTESAA
jgi:tetratricopeptide (TPR) repeat protein